MVLYICEKLFYTIINSYWALRIFTFTHEHYILLEKLHTFKQK